MTERRWEDGGWEGVKEGVTIGQVEILKLPGKLHLGMGRLRTWTVWLLENVSAERDSRNQQNLLAGGGKLRPREGPVGESVAGDQAGRAAGSACSSTKTLSRSSEKAVGEALGG